MCNTKGMTQFMLSDASNIIANNFPIRVYCLCHVGCSAFSAAVHNLCYYAWICHLYPILSPQYMCVFLLGRFSVRNIFSFCAFSLQSFANWSIMIIRLLTENPLLLQLYRDLVITHVISSEEFWSQHALQYMQEHQNQKQDVGVSGAFLVCFGLQL